MTRELEMVSQNDKYPLRTIQIFHCRFYPISWHYALYSIMNLWTAVEKSWLSSIWRREVLNKDSRLGNFNSPQTKKYIQILPESPKLIMQPCWIPAWQAVKRTWFQTDRFLNLSALYSVQRGLPCYPLCNSDSNLPAPREDHVFNFQWFTLTLCLRA